MEQFLTWSNFKLEVKFNLIKRLLEGPVNTRERKIPKRNVCLAEPVNSQLEVYHEIRNCVNLRPQPKSHVLRTLLLVLRPFVLTTTAVLRDDIY